jgi:[Acyl-carrier-protein] S-malonyltransferase (EC 2.3.1.39)
MSYALVFPGQGSQTVGMLGQLGARFPEVRHTLDEAASVLGWDVPGLIESGPEAELNRTERTQPAMLAADIAVWRCWASRVATPPAWLAGHSLGEYAALVVAGSLDFADALKLVELRAQLMQAAADAAGEKPGMAAILGLDDGAVDALCAEVPSPAWLEAANYNAPGQVVVAGDAPGLAWLRENGRARGARKVVELAMSVPSHCRLMREASAQLAAALEQVSFRATTVPVLHNLDAAPHPEPDAIRHALAEQLHRPVRWVQSVRRMHASGIEHFLECGPGKVLSGVNRRTAEGAECVTLEDPAQLQEVAGRIEQAGNEA